MNIDPKTIADLITEDPNQFNHPQDPQASDINKRESFMVQLINMTHNANVPLTAEGYNQIGRSNGFLELMSGPIPWGKLTSSDQFAKLAVNLSPNLKKQILAEIVRSISR